MVLKEVFKGCRRVDPGVINRSYMGLTGVLCGS